MPRRGIRVSLTQLGKTIAEASARPPYLKHCPLQSRDSGRRRELFGAMLGAAHVAVARMAPGVAGNRAQPCQAFDIPFVPYQGPGANQRGRAEVIRIRRHDIAGAIAHRAADAFDGGVHLNARF